MKSSLVALAIVAVSSLLAGCATETEPGTQDAAENDAEELVSGRGIALTKTGDTALKIAIKFADGVQASTKNKRFIRVTIGRGSKTFGMWCDGSGQMGAAGEIERIECDSSALTISDDDNEGFELTIEKKNGTYTIHAEDAGDGTFFGDRMQILQPDWAWRGGPSDPIDFALSVSRGEGSAADPFPMLADVGSRLAAVIGEPIANHQTRPLPATTVQFELSDTMEVTSTLFLSTTGRISASSGKASVLQTPGDLASGLATGATVKSRVLAALKK